MRGALPRILRTRSCAPSSAPVPAWNTSPKPRQLLGAPSQARAGSTWNTGSHAPQPLWPACQRASDEMMSALSGEQPTAHLKRDHRPHHSPRAPSSCSRPEHNQGFDGSQMLLSVGLQCLPSRIRGNPSQTDHWGLETSSLPNISSPPQAGALERSLRPRMLDAAPVSAASVIPYRGSVRSCNCTRSEACVHARNTPQSI